MRYCLEKVKKPKAPKPPKEPKVEKTSEQLAREYADRIINGKIARGHTDKRFAYTKKDSTVNKEMWIDTDFFFSVVFQSLEQKYEFIKKVAWKTEVDHDSKIQIVNGLDLAKQMGIELKKETAQDSPYASLDLLPFVLDNETI